MVKQYKEKEEKKKYIPWFSTLEPHFQLRLVPPASIQKQAQSTSYCFWLVTSGLPSLHDSSVNEIIPDEQKDLARRSTKQMFWSDGSVLEKKGELKALIELYDGKNNLILKRKKG